MAFGGFILTNAGRNLLAQIQAGQVQGLNFTKFEIGDGTAPLSITTMTTLVSSKLEVPITNKTSSNGTTNIMGAFDNKELETAFYFKEWGIFVSNGQSEILYAYDNAGADAELIAESGAVLYEKKLKAALVISSDVAVTISTVGTQYAELEHTHNNATSSVDGMMSKEDKNKLDAIAENANNYTHPVTHNADMINVTSSHFTSTNVEGALDELFQYANDGKVAIKTSMSDKGVTVSLDDTFALLAAKITAQMCKFAGTANPADVASGRTFINSTGELLTGTMAVKSSYQFDNTSYTIKDVKFFGSNDSGYYGTIVLPIQYTGYVQNCDINQIIYGLNPEVIKTGQIIGNVTTGTTCKGTYDAESTNPITSATVLSSKVGFVNGSKITGTMVDRSGWSPTMRNQNQLLLIQQGYYDGTTYINANITNLIQENIKKGVSVGGVVGTFTSDATAASSDLLNGKVAYVNGCKITGTITSKAAQTYTPTTSSQIIASGQYLSGSQTIIGDANLVAENIKDGIQIFGVTGTLVEKKQLVNTVTKESGLNFITISVPFTPRTIVAYIPGTQLIMIHNASGIDINNCNSSTKNVDIIITNKINNQNVSAYFSSSNIFTIQFYSAKQNVTYMFYE